MSTGLETRSQDGVSIKSGLLGGIVAYALGFVVVSVMSYVEPGITPGQGQTSTATDLGWMFYSSHAVDIAIEAGGQSETFSLFAEGETTIPEVAFYLAPAVVLAAVGYWLASSLAAGTDGGSRATTGASVAVGYLPLALAGTFLFEESGSTLSGTATIAPDLTESLLFAGLLFPILFGAVGGYLASR